MKKGCLSKLIFFIIIIFTGLTIVVGGIYTGLMFFKYKIENQLNPTNQELQIRAEKLADFSKIPISYSVIKALNITGIKIIVAEHFKSEQIMLLSDSSWVINVSKKDILENGLENKIKNIILKINNQDKLKINNFMIETIDSFKAFNQDIPYAKVTFSVSGNYNKEFKGIIGVVKNSSTGKNNLVISYNTPDKYNQLTAERFFKNVEFFKKS